MREILVAEVIIYNTHPSLHLSSVVDLGFMLHQSHMHLNKMSVALRRFRPFRG